ncbi:protein bric-a-brac 1-like [Chironomus tepperi]|uniref:protein bric-a-brac 1-like n=1 Tax=Chironomus tepperi TaxID=113505 RepID=UPI00391FBC41
MVTFNRKQPQLNLKYYDFLNRESLVDATIIAGGHVIQAHKVILAAASTYFEEIFALIPDKHPAIVLSDVTESQLKSLMQYIYCGKVDVKDTDIAPFKKILTTLKIEINIEDTRQHPKTSATVTATVTSNPKRHDSYNEIQIKEEKVDDDENCIQVFQDSEFMDCSTDYQQPELESPKQSSFRQRFSLPQLQQIKSQKSPRIARVSAGQEMSRHRTKLDNVVRSKEHRRFMDLNPLDCPFCMKTSSTNKHRNEHVKYCTMNPDRIVSKCYYCDKNFCDPYYVRKHMKTIHADKEDLEEVLRKKN